MEALYWKSIPISTIVSYICCNKHKFKKHRPWFQNSTPFYKKLVKDRKNFFLLKPLNCSASQLNWTELIHKWKKEWCKEQKTPWLLHFLQIKFTKYKLNRPIFHITIIELMPGYLWSIKQDFFLNFTLIWKFLSLYKKQVRLEIEKLFLKCMTLLFCSVYSLKVVTTLMFLENILLFCCMKSRCFLFINWSIISVD